MSINEQDLQDVHADGRRNGEVAAYEEVIKDLRGMAGEAFAENRDEDAISLRDLAERMDKKVARKRGQADRHAQSCEVVFAKLEGGAEAGAPKTVEAGEPEQEAGEEGEQANEEGVQPSDEVLAAQANGSAYRPNAF